MTEANITVANLFQANLTDTNLTEVKNLEEAILTEEQLKQCHFERQSHKDYSIDLHFLFKDKANTFEKFNGEKKEFFIR